MCTNIFPKKEKKTICNSLYLEIFLVASLVEKEKRFKISAICENRVSAFFVVDNRRPVSGNSLTYEDVNEDDCIKMCSENRVSAKFYFISLII